MSKELEELESFIESLIRRYESNSCEAIQERNDESDADKELAKSEACVEILQKITELKSSEDGEEEKDKNIIYPQKTGWQ
jgi:hypothetical protein